MSYESTNILARGANLARVRELVTTLGFKKTEGLEYPGRLASYYWVDETDYRSWSGISLDIIRKGVGPIRIYTRSSASRSYWDLKHQNNTIRLLRDVFGGHFTTDVGRNRMESLRLYSPAKPLTSGCYLARWHFQNALGLADLYLMNRQFQGQIAKDGPSGLWFVDQHNPRLLSNNFLVPYVIAVWEDYFRSTFAAALRYSKDRESALKRARLNHAHLEQVALGAQSIERAIAESFSFQRPSAIAENFRLLDPKLDLRSPLRKPYRRRKTSLYESIEELVEARNAFVHSGRMNMTLFDKPLKTVFSDIKVAVDRSYQYVAAHFGFTPITDY